MNNGPVVSGDKVSIGVREQRHALPREQDNPRLGAIRVTKQTTINGVNFPSDNGGWHITVKSANCGVNQTKDTAQGLPYGIVSFTNLPACTDYVVSEDVNSVPGYSAINPATVSGVIVTGDSAVLVEFLNNRLLGLPLPARMRHAELHAHAGEHPHKHADAPHYAGDDADHRDDLHSAGDDNGNGYFPARDAARRKEHADRPQHGQRRRRQRWLIGGTDGGDRADARSRGVGRGRHREAPQLAAGAGSALRGPLIHHG